MMEKAQDKAICKECGKEYTLSSYDMGMTKIFPLEYRKPASCRSCLAKESMRTMVEEKQKEVDDKRKIHRLEKELKINDLIRRIEHYAKAPALVEVRIANDNAHYLYGTFTRRKFTITPVKVKDAALRKDVGMIKGKYRNFDDFKQKLERCRFDASVMSAVSVEIRKRKREYIFSHNGVFSSKKIAPFGPSILYCKVADVVFETWKRR